MKHLMKDLHIRATSKCNFNCLHCYAADWFEDGVELDLESIISTIDQAIPLGCEIVTFTGGEPLVSKATIPSMKYCIEKNLEVEIESNGLLIDQLISQIAEKDLQKIDFAISYDGEKMRDKKYMQKVRSNIETLKNLNCSIKIQTVITHINLDEAEHIFEFSNKLGIKNRVFLGHSPNGNAKELPLFKVNQWLDIIGQLKKQYSHLVLEVPRIFTGGTPKNCGWGFSRCEIMPNGDVTSCAPITFNQRKFIAGNIKDKPLVELWNSPYFEEIRKITQSDYKGVCSKCLHWKNCQGACRSISWSTGGDLLSSHPFCEAFYEEVSANNALLDKSTVSSMAKLWYEAISKSMVDDLSCEKV